MKYTVVLEALAPVYITLEVDAIHPQDALLIAAEIAAQTSSKDFGRCPPELTGYEVYDVREVHPLAMHDGNEYIFTICEEHRALRHMAN